MANTPPNSSRSHESQNPRVARRNLRLPRASPYSAHYTLSGIAARLQRHDQQIRDMDIELQETRENWTSTLMGQVALVSEDHEGIVTTVNTLQNQLGTTIGTMDVVHDRVIVNGNEILMLQLRLERCEALLRDHGETIRMTNRLVESVDRITALLTRLNIRQD